MRDPLVWARRIVRLYPFRWRERYQFEVLGLIEDTGLDWRAAINLAAGAGGAWLREAQGVGLSAWPNTWRLLLKVVLIVAFSIVANTFCFRVVSLLSPATPAPASLWPFGFDAVMLISWWLALSLLRADQSDSPGAPRHHPMFTNAARWERELLKLTLSPDDSFIGVVRRAMTRWRVPIVWLLLVTNLTMEAMLQSLLVAMRASNPQSDLLVGPHAYGGITVGTCALFFLYRRYPVLRPRYPKRLNLSHDSLGLGPGSTV